MIAEPPTGDLAALLAGRTPQLVHDRLAPLVGDDLDLLASLRWQLQALRRVPAPAAPTGRPAARRARRATPLG